MKHLAMGFVGLGFGFVLSGIGFSRFEEVQHMFLFEDLRLTLTFGGAVLLLAPIYALLKKRLPSSPRPVHRGVIVGAILFGAGWAITGACPSIALVQLGEGQLAALYTLSGIVLGVALQSYVQRRWLRWNVEGCST